MNDYTTITDLTVEPTNTKPRGFNVHHTLGQQTLYYNYTDKNIILQGRNGIPFQLEPQVCDRPTPGLLIRVEYRIGRHVNVLPNNVINAHVEHHKDIQALKDSVLHATENRDGTRSFSVEYYIATTDLNKAKDQIYLPQIDLLITSSNSNIVGVHPHCHLASHLDDVRLMQKESFNGGFLYKVGYVDNTGSVTDKFFNFNGTVHQLRPTKSKELKSGFYLYTTRYEDNEDKLESAYYTLEDGAEALNLYETYEEALNYGDVGKQRERDLAERAHAIKQKEMDFKDVEVEHKRLKAEREKELEAFQSRMERERLDAQEQAKDAEMYRERRKQEMGEELAQLKHQRELLMHDINTQSMQRKDYYEDRSHFRKDTSETVKYIPMILSAVAGIASFVIAGQLTS